MTHNGLIFLLIALAAGVGLKGPLLLMRVLANRRSSLRTSSREETDIKAVDCSRCGYHVEGADEEELFDQLQIHTEQDHPELRLTDEQIGELIASRVYNVP